MKRRTTPRPTRHAERGVVIIFGLIALVIMLIGAVAMVRSMNSSLANAGNLGFKRDLTNQGERAMAVVLAQMQGGGLASEASRQTNNPALNYRAVQFTAAEVTAQGLPVALLDNDEAFAAVGSAARDITVDDMGVRVRYVVDRLCQGSGVALAESCVMASGTLSNSANSSDPQTAEYGSAGGAGAVPQQVVYRLSVRVDGPRQTQAFFQTTFTL